MGIAQGDLNCDGKLDLFVTNFGSYAREVLTSLPFLFPSGSFSLNYPTRWFFNDDTVNGNFAPNTNNITDYEFVSPFGWGCTIFDYDNDGDYDILAHGSLDASIFGTIADNPGFCTFCVYIVVHFDSVSAIQNNINIYIYFCK